MSPALVALSLLSAVSTANAPVWSELEPGLSYRMVEVPSKESWRRGRLHVFRVSLKTHKLVPLDARKQGRTRATVTALASQTEARLVVNGTYFDERDRPLGLLIGAQGQLNPLRHADWGVFYISDGRARLIHTTAWKKRKPRKTDFAIQVGPRCVIDGQPVKLKPQVARRAALGVLDDSHIVVVLSTSELLSSDLAHVMSLAEARGGVGCRDAVMLDGGGSAQLWGKVGDRTWNLPGAWPVPNAVAVVRR